MLKTNLFCALLFLTCQKGIAQGDAHCFSGQYSTKYGNVELNYTSKTGYTSKAFDYLVCFRYTVLNSSEKNIDAYFYCKEVDNKIYLSENIDSISLAVSAGIYGYDGSLTITNDKYILYKPIEGNVKLMNCSLSGIDYSNNTDLDGSPEDSPVVENEDTLYDLKDPIAVEPNYPGGLDSLMLYLKTNLVYPQISKEIGAEGTVYIQFIVEKDGSISEILILRGVEDHINKEAIRLIMAMPKWIPGYLKGEAVRVKYILPIKFRLN